MFIAISTRVRHSTISWSVRFHLHPQILFLKIVFSIISLSVPRLPKYFLCLRFSYQNVICISMGPRIYQKSRSHLKILRVKRVTRNKLHTEYEAPPGRLGARHYVSLLCTADLSVHATLLCQLKHIITLAISNPSVQKQNARPSSVLLELQRLRKRRCSPPPPPLQLFLSGSQFCDSFCFQWDLYFKMHPVFIVVSLTVILAFYIKIPLCQLTGSSEYIRELVVESQNL
jgi:hypothetical protein